MKHYLTLGVTLLAGAALIETALVPGLVIGGAAVLAPKILPKVLPKLRRPAKARLAAKASPRAARTIAVAPTATDETKTALTQIAPGFALKRAILKTITFRIIVTSLDFTTNYVVIGELAPAAGLSAFSLVAGPLFYLAHEMVWSRLGPAQTVDVAALLTSRKDATDSQSHRSLTINRALAKTITFRTIASTVDFAATYVVVGDFVTAVSLTAFGFIVGPFVYWGHEKLWDHYAPDTSDVRGSEDLANVPLLSQGTTGLVPAQRTN